MLGTGFNYEALSCESCKVFFHRNAPTPGRLRCRKEGTCEIDFASRRADKCFSVGMKWKNADLEVRERIRSMTENGSDIRTVLLEKIDLPENVSQQKAEVLKQIHTSSLSPLTGSTTASPYARKKKYAADLNVIERQLIGELQSAINSAFVDELSLPCIGEVKNVIDKDFINLPVHYIRRMVRFVKNLSAFSVLSEDDKMAAVKTVFYGNALAEDGHPVLADEQGTQTVFITFKACEVMHEKDTHERNRKFCYSFKEELEGDATLRDLFYIYNRLLRRYLEHKYKSVNQANRKYATLVRYIDQMGPIIKECIQKMFKGD
ncbi:Oxysterols receptor LXR-alpha [Tyrophagus putrescentiae]|nr:Oxysterols receptor LXR-alpha [Tyrophagus putrescentiae]